MTIKDTLPQALDMIDHETRRGECEPPSDDQRDGDHPAPRKNDEVPGNRQDADVSRADDDQTPHGDRRGS